MVAWLEEELPGARMVLAAVAAGHGDQALALGLALRAVLDGPDEAARIESRTRVEPLLGGVTLEERGGRAWAAAAEGDDLEARHRGRERCPARRVTRPSGCSTCFALARWPARARCSAAGCVCGCMRSGRRLTAARGFRRLPGPSPSTGWLNARAPGGWPGRPPALHVGFRPRTPRRRRIWPPRHGATSTPLLTPTWRGRSCAMAARSPRSTRHSGGWSRLLTSAAPARSARSPALLAGWSVHAQTGPGLLGVEDLLAELVAPLAAPASGARHRARRDEPPGRGRAARGCDR